MDAILNPEVQRFIEANLEADVKKLALSKNPFPDIDWKIILNQIIAKQKSKDKLPTWFGEKNIVYPDKISIEQSSSEITARYKASLVAADSIIDLTGGFGVDDYYFAKSANRVVHCEINSGLSAVVKHNFEMLGAENIECLAGDSFEILKKINQKWDWIYLDPSRRSQIKGKVFLLKDCLPNVPQHLGLYFSYANNIMVKTSPLLDISAGLAELGNVKSIHIVSLNNQVRELLWVLKKDYSGDIAIDTVDFGKNQTHFGFNYAEGQQPRFALPGRFLYEPNAAIMKSGGFDVVSCQLKIGKLHQHSHLYTSDEKIDFPGRVFKIVETLAYNKMSMRDLSNKKANVTARNFPDTVEAIRKKWRIPDGGDRFYFFTTNMNNDKIVLICEKI